MPPSVSASSNGRRGAYLIPSDYPLTDQTAVSPLLPYKIAGLTLAFAEGSALLTAVFGRYAILVLLIGGTFTDIVIYDHADGRQWSRKVLTTHDDPARAVTAGVAATLAEAGLASPAVTRGGHATTLFTNALIERKGASTGLITTAGFRDTLEMGRERKYELYDLAISRPEPLVPRHLCLEVTERIKADGSVHQPLDRDEVLARADGLVAAGATSLAVVFLHAYANPAHEAEAVRLIAGHPGLHTTASHEVPAEIREYERMSTTVVNAYIKPLAHGYLGAMVVELASLGIPAPLLLWSSGDRRKVRPS